MLSLIGCSSDIPKKGNPNRPKSIMAKPVWFDVPKRFSTTNRLGDVDTHPFFDLNAYFSKSSSEISYYMVTPLDSRHQYQLDLVSGQRYLAKSFCDQKDVWEKYKGKINRPPFAQGIIPRLMDQLGSPQQIWVFGDKTDFVPSKKELRVQSQRANIVGGLILQYCRDYPCKYGSEWLSRLILLGVNPFDKDFKGIKDLSQLKKKVDWQYILAFAENGFGSSMSGSLREPAYRIGGEVDNKNVLDFAFRNGHLFSFDEINSLRKNCFSLYDYIWKGQKLARIESKKKKKSTDKYAIEYEKRANLLRGIQELSIATVFDDKTNVELKKDHEKLKTLFFNKFWLKLINKYDGRMKTCFDFVRASNVKEDIDRTWFFAYVQNWINLEDLGYFYSCSRHSWMENPIIGGKKRKYPKHETSDCSAKDIDIGFKQAITVMSGLTNAKKNYYRYIEYDSRLGGSHEMIYNWVYDKGKDLSCDARKLEDKKTLFPFDVRWKDFYMNKRKNLYDVIH